MARLNEEIANGPSKRHKPKIKLQSLGNWSRSFENLKWRRGIILCYLVCLQIYHSFSNYYLKEYGKSLSTTTARKRFRSSGDNASLVSAIRRRVGSSTPTIDGSHFTPWRWKTLPGIWRWLDWYRVVNTVYVVYVLIKNVAPAVLEEPLRQLNLSMPVNCYLLGRFMPNVGARRTMASLFAFWQLIWRYFQFYSPNQNYMISSLYFLMLDDRDINNYHRLLKGMQRPPELSDALTRPIQARPDGTTMMLHDIMSVRVDHLIKPVYQLRPNRTSEASRLLRDCLARVTLFGIAAFAVSFQIIFVILVYTGIQNGRYLEDYPGCSPKLKELYDRDELGNGLYLSLRGHEILALMVDTFENLILWLDSGLNTVLFIPISTLINLDLQLYWEYVDAKIIRLLGDVRDPQVGMANQKRYDIDRDRQVYELQIEWQDFVNQVKQADAIIGDALSMSILIWFTLFGAFTYDSIVSPKGHSLPLVMYVTLLVVVFDVTAVSVGLFRLHRNCQSSYTRFCSLMAHDCSKHKLKFIDTMDFFTRKRTSFTLCRRHEMSPSTYLRIVGWSFSFFCVFGSLHKR